MLLITHHNQKLAIMGPVDLNKLCNNFEVTFSPEHYSLFRQLLACLSLVHARCVKVIKRLIVKNTHSIHSYPKKNLDKLLQDKFFGEQAFNQYIQAHIYLDY
jgi:hypothetical protein